MPKFHHRFILFSIIFFLFGIFVPAQSWGSEVAKLSVPSWVSPVLMADIEGFPKEQIANGVYYRLVDRQTLVQDAKEPESFYHFAEYIVNQAGVEGSSQINIDYDPSYQQLILHKLHILRNDEVFDKIDSARMKLIQREQELESLIYNGRETLNIILDDVRVGDTIEYSYSIVGTNPVYQDYFSSSHSLNWTVPVGRLSIRLLWEKRKKLNYKIQESDLKLEINESLQGTEYLIQGDHIEPVSIDENVPSWFSPWGFVDFSDQRNWQEVAQWGAGLYENIIKSDAEIQKIVAEIKSQHNELDSQISAALRFVQDEIRYFGVELGQNSHLPRTASETLVNRYGDCKDKAVLFLTILKELGVKGYPVLVDTDKELNTEQIPSIHSFDHVITLVEHENKSYWLDPTRSYQHGGINDIHQPDYKYALVLRDGEQQLTEMSPQQSHFGVDIKDEFVLTSSEVTFLSTTTNFGWNAERQRQRLASNGENKIQREYLEFFQTYYSDIEIDTHIKFEDDKTNNVFTTIENYQINNFWYDNTDEQANESDFYANLITPSIRIPDELRRSHPLRLSHPESLRQTIEVTFEDDNWEFDDSDFVEENDYFDFSQSVKFEKHNKKLTLVYTYQSKVDQVIPEKYSDYLSGLEKVRDYRSYGIYKPYGSVDESSNIEKSEKNDSSLFLILDDVFQFAFGFIYFIFPIISIILWRIDRKRNPEVEAFYYPVSVVKFIALWIFTFSIYGMYWFYKNFQYIKKNEETSSIPWARGLFMSLWYYPLWKNLHKDSHERYAENKLIDKSTAILFSLLFLLTIPIIRIDSFYFVGLVAGGLLVIPLVKYILIVNGEASEAFIQNSKWSFRHYLVSIFGVIALLVFLGEQSLTPNQKVIKGDKIPQYVNEFMINHDVISQTGEVEYFYSDAFLLIKNEGNGFTKSHIFSYWRNDDDSIDKELVSFSEVNDINIEWSTSFLDHTIITIDRNDGSEFQIFIAKTDNKDKTFVNALYAQWLEFK